MILSLSTISLDFIKDLSYTKSKNVWCNVLRLDDMHASLPSLEYKSPPSLTLFCLLFEAFLIFLCRLIRVLAIHSIVNAVPIMGCPRWLLLQLFTKHDCAPKCGVTWFIMNELNQSFIFWILLRIVLLLIVCIVPTLIKRFSICRSPSRLPISRELASS